MTEWLYRATPTKVSFEDTRALAADDGFICRSAFEENGTRADNTQHVDFRDVIHVYFTENGEPRVIGSFEVVGPNRHPLRERFGSGVRGTALLEVKDEDFVRRLTGISSANGEGYQRDPVLKKITGWAVIARPDIATPPYSPDVFPNQGTLVRIRA